MIIDIQMNFETLRNTLQQSYNQSHWRGLLGDIFGNQISFETKAEQIFIEKGQAKKIERFASVALSDYKNIAVLDILTSAEVQIARNRVALRDIAFKLIDQDKYHGLLVFYHSEDENQLDYRLSFISNQTVIDNDGNFVNQSTHPKRFSFILGENESCYTPAQRLLNLKGKQPQFIAFENNPGISIKDLTETFSVEALNKEFFKKYKDIHYRKLWEHIVTKEEYCNLLVNNEESDADKKLKPVRDFAKKMLGRIVFLHYIQKKGWLGCSASISGWNDGDKHFILNLYKHYPNKENFYSKCLTTLFYKVLNSRRNNDLIPEVLMYKGKEGNSTASFKAPFLNGGLFDDDQPETNNFDFPVEYFSDLFEFFSQYNFTIDENSPDEQEVGIDPEMLGHIFENLLEENKDKGAFYTPKEIVHYMCQESLIQYLRTHLQECADDNSPATIAIENFIRKDDVGDRADKKNFIVQNASRINHLLDIVKICDPAIGSGAFPMGMLQEIFEAKCILNLTLNNAEKAQLKKDIIQNSIYGVDIESGAVDIARLRFWLSLVVEEEVPQPLPNLDYKIMQGNSLLEGIEDVDLSNLFVNEKIEKNYLKAKHNQLVLGEEFLGVSESLQFEEAEKSELNAMLNLYFDFEESNFGKYKTKQDIKARINKIIEDKLKFKFKKDRDKLLEALEVKLTHLASNDIKPTDPNGIIAKKQKNVDKLNKEISSIENNIKELSNILDRIKKWENQEKERPYFLWHTYFKDVFDEGGFDIVIGNPPYLRIQGIREVDSAFADQLCKQYKSATGSFDLYVIFVEKSLQIIKEDGLVNYIMPVKWTNGAFGKGLRSIIAQNEYAQKIVNFGAYQVFNASTYTGLQWFKKNSEKLLYSELDRNLETNTELEKYLINLTEDKFAKIDSEKINSEDSWTLTIGNTSLTLGEIIKNKRSFKDIFEKIFQGLATGKDDVYFLYNSNERDDTIIGYSKFLSCEVEIEKTFVKPLLKGEDVHKYDIITTDRTVIFPYKVIDEKVLLYTENEIEDIFPLGYSYLKKCEKELRTREKGRYDIDGEWFQFSRKQGMLSAQKEKLVAPEISLGGNFAYDVDGKFYATTKIYGYIKKQTIKESYRFWLGLCNSNLFWFYLKNTGYVLRGGYFTFKTDYVNPFPVPEIISPIVVENIEICVDYIHLLKNNQTPQLSHLVSNEFIIRQFENIIDGCVYELYFEEHMKDRRIDIAHSANEILIPIANEDDLQKKYKTVQEVFNRLQTTDNEVRSRLELFVYKSPEYLKTIIQT